MLLFLAVNMLLSPIQDANMGISSFSRQSSVGKVLLAFAKLLEAAHIMNVCTHIHTHTYAYNIPIFFLPHLHTILLPSPHTQY